MKTRTAIVDLLKAEPEWRHFFKQCCEASPLRLRSQAWQWRDELADRGQAFELADLEDVLMGLARKFFPGSPAAQWDPEWADKLTGDAMDRMQKHYSDLSEAERDALDLSGQDSHEAQMLAAGEENNPAAFRSALRAWERAGLESLENARTKRGAA